jgi:hypothetical protein
MLGPHEHRAIVPVNPSEVQKKSLHPSAETHAVFSVQLALLPRKSVYVQTAGGASLPASKTFGPDAPDLSEPQPVPPTELNASAGNMQVDATYRNME